MASDSEKLARLKSILAKRSASSNSHPANAADISDIATETVSPTRTRAIGSGAQVDRTADPRNDRPLQCTMPSALSPTGRGQLLSCVQTVRQPAQTPNGSGASKLERLKAVLSDSQRRNSTSPLDVVPAQGLGSPLAAACENAPSDCSSPAAQSCNGRDSCGQAAAATTDAMTAEPSERAKRLKELLARQAKTKLVQMSDAPPPLEPVAALLKGPDNSLASDASDSRPEDSRTVERIPWGKLPVGEQVPVVFLGIGDKGKVVYLQELSAQRDLVEMIKALNLEVPKEGRPVKEYVPGTHVAILRSEDMTLYRGRICGTGSPGDNEDTGGDRPREDKVRVLFVDYGRQEYVSPRNILRLPVAFELLPAFAVPVRLDGVPAINLPEGTSFDGALFDARVAADDSGDGLQSVRLYLPHSHLCLNDSLALSATGS